MYPASAIMGRGRMDSNDLVGWLLKEGGPAIRYRTALELAGTDGAAAALPLLEDLLRTQRVQWLLRQMDSFEPYERMDIRVLNALHGMKPQCLENVVARLLELGLRAGVADLDTKMERLHGYIDHPLVRRALADRQQATVDGGRAVFVAIVCASYLLRGGYYDDAIVQFVQRRLALLDRLASEKTYEIYLTPAELHDLPKQWAGKPIIRPEMAPTAGDTPLPLVHDFFALAYLPRDRMSLAVRKQVEDVVAYASDERYRALAPGYGYLWSSASPRVCHGCGWSLDLPDPDSANRYEQRKIVQRLELLARLPGGAASRWFQRAMQVIESYRTSAGTYCLPRSYLVEAKSGYYVGGDYMGLEDKRKTDKALELESTLRVLLLKKLLQGA